MNAPIVVICIDGLDPDYLEACETPNLDEMARKGFLAFGLSMMPSVTNVNNVSLVTGRYPSEHGIASNYLRSSETGGGQYMESADYVRAESLFERAASLGKRSLLVTSKDKLRTLLGRGATISVSSEKAPDWVTAAVGAPPEIYSLEVNGWAIRAATFIASREPADVIYVSTTDYAMHTFAPDEPESQRHMTILDGAIGDLVAAMPEAAVLITADHGMSAKTRMVDVAGELERKGIAAEAVPIIKDRYTVHHSNLGGCTNVYLRNGEVDEAAKVLRETRGVERALPRDEAAELWRLPADRIGDVVVTGEADVVFGDPGEVALPERLRSHASEHERGVPILGYNGDFEGREFAENVDVGRYVFDALGGSGPPS